MLHVLHAGVLWIERISTRDRFSLQNREAVPTPTVWARNLAAASAVNLFLGDCAGFGAARHANKNDVGSVQYFWPIFCVKGDEKVALDYDNFVKIIGNYDADSDQASNTFNEFAVKSKDSLGTMNDMNEGINNISIAIEESAKGVTNVAQEISQLVTAISAITVQAGENKNLSEDLSDEVAKFEKV